VKAMKTRFAILAALAVLTVGVGSVFAESSERYYPPQVIGKKARKQIRHFLFIKNLENDKRAVYEKYGYTPHRLRINFAGRVTERWIYYSDGRYFEFDQEGNLIEERRVAREDGHLE
jgi:hypothetical protein